MTCIECGEKTAQYCPGCASLVGATGQEREGFESANVVSSAAIAWYLAIKAYQKELSRQKYPEWWDEGNVLLRLGSEQDATWTAFERAISRHLMARPV